jgi:hypothetical protein
MTITLSSTCKRKTGVLAGLAVASFRLLFLTVSALHFILRAHRIGQLNCVNVYNLVTNNSIEEKIVELQRKKIAISGAIVNTENSSMYSMGTDRILDIFTSRSSANANNAEGETLDIDALIEQHGNDYASLSVDEFLKGLERNSVL